MEFIIHKKGRGVTMSAVTKIPSTVVSDSVSPALQQEQLMGLIKLAVESDNGMEKLEKLMELQDRWEINNAKKAFNTAMSVFQSQLPIIEKKGVVDFTSSKGRTYYEYARLEDIAQSIKPALEDARLSYSFKQKQEAGMITVRCIITHKDGHSEYSEMSSAPDNSGGKDQLKSIASAVSYLRRYTLTGILGVVVGGEDDEHPFGADEQPVYQDCYSEEEFNEKFDTWSECIKSKKHTAKSLSEFLGSRNKFLTEAQFLKLDQVGK